MGAHRGELGGASLVRFLAESIVGYLGGKGGEIVLFPPQISVDFLREVVDTFLRWTNKTVKSKTAHRLFGGKKKRTKSFGETLKFTDKFHYQESVAVYKC